MNQSLGSTQTPTPPPGFPHPANFSGSIGSPPGFNFSQGQNIATSLQTPGFNNSAVYPGIRYGAGGVFPYGLNGGYMGDQPQVPPHNIVPTTNPPLNSIVQTNGNSVNCATDNNALKQENGRSKESEDLAEKVSSILSNTDLLKTAISQMSTPSKSNVDSGVVCDTPSQDMSSMPDGSSLNEVECAGTNNGSLNGSELMESITGDLDSSIT